MYVKASFAKFFKIITLTSGHVPLNNLFDSVFRHIYQSRYLSRGISSLPFYLRCHLISYSEKTLKKRKAPRGSGLIFPIFCIHNFEAKGATAKGRTGKFPVFSLAYPTPISQFSLFPILLSPSHC